MEIKKRIARVSTLPLLALRGLVVFPEMVLHFDVGRSKSLQALNEAMGRDQTISLVPQKDMREDDPEIGDLYRIGVVAKVRQVLKMPGDTVRVLVEGLYRARLQEMIQEEPYQTAVTRECAVLRLSATPPGDGATSASRSAGGVLAAQALLRECRKAFDVYMSFSPKLSPDVPAGVAAAEDIGYLADYIASNIMLETEDKQALLEMLNPKKRIEHVMVLLHQEASIMALEQGIHDRVREQINQNQRDYYLREQLKIISSELGEGDSPLDESQEYRLRILRLAMGEEAEEKLLGECDKLSKMPSGSHEATVVRGYLETCLSLPWNKMTKDKFDLAASKKILDRDHYGMTKVKDRILELLAVRQLAPDIKGQVICLAGPPGVGKTSVARSVAAAMGRKYVRISLGGTRDESDIRGHRRTYIGAMPGRIISAIKQAGTANPVILLDEIDKMGNDFRGDPSSAMLEVLDTEQNSAFRDHYVELPFDLSRVLFITTANNVDAIPRPLYDRMEVISLPSYTADEKFHIAKGYLLKKQVRRHGLTPRQVRIADEVMRDMIDGYTRESGVRELERCITKLCRKAARHVVETGDKTVTVTPARLAEFLGPRKYRGDAVKTDDIGVANGLAWTAVGGEVMPIEVAVLEGTGKVELTGSLGDVMKESARTAISYVRSRAKELRIDHDFYKNKDIHIHVLEGAVPKDGPSAGVTIAAAMISALTGIPVRSDTAMTGEISLRGRVLPIGGLREKTMAAYRQQIKTVIIPSENEPDLDEVDTVVRDHIRFVTADHLDTVIGTALVSPPVPPAGVSAPAGAAAPRWKAPLVPPADDGAHRVVTQ